MEIWKDVIEFEGIYKVSNLGRIKALERDVDYGNRICHRKEHILRQNINNDGYYQVKLLDNKQHSVHRIVAEAFYGKHPGYEVDHIDAVRTNNNADNLRWVDHRTNIIHTYEVGNGHMAHKTYDKNFNSKKVKIYNNLEEKFFDSLKECAEWIRDNILNKTKVSSIYDSLRKHNINQKPYCGYYIEY